MDGTRDLYVFVYAIKCKKIKFYKALMFLLAVWKHLGANLYPQERRKQLEMPGLLQRLASLGSGRGGTLTRSHNRYYYTTILHYNITPNTIQYTSNPIHVNCTPGTTPTGPTGPLAPSTANRRPSRTVTGTSPPQGPQPTPCRDHKKPN